VPGVGWLDMAAVAVLLVTAAVLILPAIGHSRLQARLATCQDGLRQFGLALTDYGRHQGSALSRLANNGRLTRAGVLAAGLLRDGYLTDSRRTLCPDAWLAAQGVLPRTSPVATQMANREGFPPAVSGIGPRLVSGSPSSGVSDRRSDWPGAWRDGTTDGGRQAASPAEVPLLADAPSADLPGQGLPSHGGRGRNVFFEDGRIVFLPTATPVGATDAFLSRSEDAAAYGISAPIVLVSGHY